VKGLGRSLHYLDLYVGMLVLNILTIKIIDPCVLLLQKLKTSGLEMIQLFLCYLAFGYVVSEQ